MNRLAQDVRPASTDTRTNDVVEAALLGHRDDFVIDLRESGRTRSYLRGHDETSIAGSGWLRFTRRGLDIGSSIILLVGLAPLLLVIGATSAATSGVPVLFSQERVGRSGKIFRCWKFRTMHRDADDRLEELLTTDSNFRREWMRDQKVRSDPRITPIGRVLRKTSLDELPQLLNVLKGEMSIVGPRPILPQETTRYGDAARRVLSVKPGITGLWQVSGRNTVSYETRVALDLRYVDEQSLATDFAILARTPVDVITGRGAS